MQKIRKISDLAWLHNKFWPFDPNYLQTRIFRNMTPRSFRSLYFYLTLRKKIKKSDEWILRNIEIWWIVAQIWPFDPVSMETRIFLKNQASSLFYIHDPLTSCKKSEKSDERFLRLMRSGRTHVCTHGRTNKPEFLGLLRRSRESKKLMFVAILKNKQNLYDCYIFLLS